MIYIMIKEPIIFLLFVTIKRPNCVVNIMSYDILTTYINTFTYLNLYINYYTRFFNLIKI